METENIWILICPNATAFRHTSVTKIEVFVNCWASGFFAWDIDNWVMWACMHGPNDAPWLQALDEDAGLDAQTIHLQESCTFRVTNEIKKFQRKLTGDGKLINGGRKCWWGCPDATGLVPIEGKVNKNKWGAFLRKVCICIGDYAHAGCRATYAFKKRLTKTITTLTVGFVGVRQIAIEFAGIWSTLLAHVKHVARAERLFQGTTKVGQFDISTSMLFLTEPKYHVRIVHGLRNHFPNTMWCKRPRLTAVKSVRYGSDRVGSQPHGSTGQWPIVERCSKNIVTFVCSAVYLRNTGISLSNLLSKTACVGGAFAAHAFHDVVSPMY